MIHNIDPQLTQWDVGRSVTVSGTNATHIHFANQGDSKAVIMEIVNESAKIPDYLLQTAKPVIAYAVLDGVTLESKSFPVRKRERPENYVYEDDQRNYIYELISDAETAVANANLAVESANEAAEVANLATANANVATHSANLATTKANTATENANLAAQNVNEAVTKANNAVKNMMVVGETEGENISLNDAIDQTLVGLRVFGKTTQDGTPTPDAPVYLVSVGASGSITVNVNGENEAQSMTIATPNGLPGIPVTSGGNYTDADGQQWICDEIDFARGVYVQRIGKDVIDGSNAVVKKNGSNADYYLYYYELKQAHGSVGCCTHFTHITGYPQLASQYGCFNITRGLAEVAFFCGYGIVTGDNATLTNASEFNGWLRDQYEAGSPVVLLYTLATPIETPLSEEELAAYADLHTYKDNTTVSNDAGAWMDLEYVMDAKKYIDSLVTGGIAPARVE